MWTKARHEIRSFNKLLNGQPRDFEQVILLRVFVVATLLAVVGYVSGFFVPGRSVEPGNVEWIRGIRLFGLGVNIAVFVLVVTGKNPVFRVRRAGLALTLLNLVLLYVTGIILNERPADAVFAFMMLMIHAILIHLYTGLFWPALLAIVVLYGVYIAHFIVVPAYTVTAGVDVEWIVDYLPTAGFLLLFFLSVIVMLSLWVGSLLYRKSLAHAEELEELAYHDQETRLPNLGKLELCMAREAPRVSVPDRTLLLGGIQLRGVDELKGRIGYQAASLWLMQFIQDFSGTLEDYFVCHKRVERVGEHVLYRVESNLFLFLAWLGPEQPDVTEAELLEDLQNRTTAVVLRCPQGERIRFTGTVAVFPADADSPRALLRNVLGILHGQELQEEFVYVPFDTTAYAGIVRHNRVMDCMTAPGFLKELRTVFQPQTTADGALWSGFEALVRWKSPVLGDIPPGDFIALAEQHFRIAALTDMVLADCLVMAGELKCQGLEGFRVAFNLSPLLANPAYLENLVERIRTSGLAQVLEIEITEGVLLKTDSDTLQSFKRLRAMGVHFAIDDFGTGYSNLAYLQSFEADRIKIDRSFVKDLEANPRSVALVQAILDVARTFGMTCIAEGVETPVQLDVLHAMGCDLVQGFMIARPLEAGQALEYALSKSGS